jgi:hypothetical protein
LSLPLFSPSNVVTLAAIYINPYASLDILRGKAHISTRVAKIRSTLLSLLFVSTLFTLQQNKVKTPSTPHYIRIVSVIVCYNTFQRSMFTFYHLAEATAFPSPI